MTLSRLFVLVAALLVLPVTGFGQVFIQEGHTLVQFDCYTLYVNPAQPNATLDLQYKLNGQEMAPIIGWPTLGPTGFAQNICTSDSTPVGDIEFTGWRINGTSTWNASDWALTILPQVGGISFDPTSGSAGIDSYTLTVAGAASMNVRLYYYLNGTPLDATIWVDENGAYSSGTLLHYVPYGNYSVYGVTRTEAINGYRPIDVTYWLRPPRPTSTSINPTTVQAGQGSYTLTVGNGGDVYLDEDWAFNGANQTRIANYPHVLPLSSGHPDGSVTFPVGACKTPGAYTWQKIKHHDDADITSAWLTMNQTVTITAPPGPTATSANPSTGQRLSTTNNVNVTINGANLCNSATGKVRFTTTWPGLSFDEVDVYENLPGTSVTTIAHISPDAWVGTATVTVIARSGTTAFDFPITTGAAPTISAIAPTKGPKGTSVPVTITGTNLTGGTLSTTWDGLTFSNVQTDTQGTQLTATFNVSASAPQGFPPLTVTNSLGNITSSAIFSIVPQAYLSREYIYLGGRVIAVEAP